MGLDMYAYRTREAIPPADFGAPEDAAEIAYWRKHPNLHGWMQMLYESKEGADPEFNCNNVRIDAADLDILDQCVRTNMLPHTTGFFFGESTAEDKLIDLAFIDAARKAIAEGDRVFYTSWW